MMSQQSIRQQGYQGKQAQQDGRGTSDGFVGPLALGFDAQMLSDVAKGGFHLPAAHEAGQNEGRDEGQGGGQQSLWVEFASDIADDDEANRNRWQASVIPNRCASGNVQLTRLVVVPGQGQASPERIGSVDKLLRGRQASAFL